MERDVTLGGILLEGDRRVRLRRPRVSLKLTPAEGGFDLFGHLSAVAVLGCVRCLADYELALAHDFRLTLVRRPHEAEEDTTGLRPIPEDDVDVFPFESDVVDVAAIVREQVDLCLPMKPLCRSECRGLCAQCGADRNQEVCGCPEPSGDSRWTALERWRGSNAQP